MYNDDMHFYNSLIGSDALGFFVIKITSNTVVNENINNMTRHQSTQDHNYN